MGSPRLLPSHAWLADRWYRGVAVGVARPVLAFPPPLLPSFWPSTWWLESSRPVIATTSGRAHARVSLSVCVCISACVCERERAGGERTGRDVGFSVAGLVSASDCRGGEHVTRGVRKN